MLRPYSYSVGGIFLCTYIRIVTVTMRTIYEQKQQQHIRVNFILCSIPGITRHSLPFILSFVVRTAHCHAASGLRNTKDTRILIKKRVTYNLHTQPRVVVIVHIKKHKPELSNARAQKKNIFCSLANTHIYTKNHF